MRRFAIFQYTIIIQAVSIKREHEESANTSNVEISDKKSKVDQSQSLQSVMQRVNKFLVEASVRFDFQGDEKKFVKAVPIYEKIINQKAKESLNEEDKVALFSGVKVAATSISVMLEKSNWDPFSKLLKTCLSNSSLFLESQIVWYSLLHTSQNWIKKWEVLLSIITSMNSDDSFVIAGMHKKIDSIISSWSQVKYLL